MMNLFAIVIGAIIIVAAVVVALLYSPKIVAMIWCGWIAFHIVETLIIGVKKLENP